MIAFQEGKPESSAQNPHHDLLRLMPIVLRYAQIFFRSWPAVHREEAIEPHNNSSQAWMSSRSPIYRSRRTHRFFRFLSDVKTRFSRRFRT